MVHRPRESGAEHRRDAAARVVRALQERGHVAYFAGGCVRDRIMGREPEDYDVATDATPKRVLELFRVARSVGEAFGVVMVRMRGCWIEVATFRTEWGYRDGRHPDHLAYSDAEHDARRRDFTINGLFYDPVADRVIDYVGGRRDIEQGVLRAIGEPRERFGEDYLRMLRAARFAAKLSMRIDEETARAIREHAACLARISRERIGMEVRLMLEHPTRARAVRAMQALHLDGPVLTEPCSARPVRLLEALPPPAAHTAALAAWVMDRHLEPPEPPDVESMVGALQRLKIEQIVRRWRRALCLSNDQRDGLREALQTLPRLLQWPDLDAAGRKRLLARSDWPALRHLLEAAVCLMGEELDSARFEEQVQQLQAEGVTPAPLISGHDLIAAGMRPGPRFKKILERTYDAQLNGGVRTVEEARALARALADEAPRRSGPAPEP